MLWLIITILAYLILAFVILIDKYLLSTSIPNAKVYSFYIGALSIIALLFIPFIDFFIPSFLLIGLALLAGALFILAIFALYSALIKFEVSRIIPVVGGILPIFTLVLVYLFSEGGEILGFYQFLAFIFLILGSVLIVLEKEKLITIKSLQFSILAAFLFALSLFLTKLVFVEFEQYTNDPFWSGFIWIRIGSFLMAIIFFLASAEIRNEIFVKKDILEPRTAKIFLSNQALGGFATILQNWAMFLVPFGMLAFINALEGIKYVFLLILTFFISLKFSQFFKEDISKKVLLQKIIAVLLIVVGLIFLFLA